MGGTVQLAPSVLCSAGLDGVSDMWIPFVIGVI